MIWVSRELFRVIAGGIRVRTRQHPATGVTGCCSWWMGSVVVCRDASVVHGNQ